MTPVVIPSAAITIENITMGIPTFWEYNRGSYSSDRSAIDVHS